MHCKFNCITVITWHCIYNGNLSLRYIVIELNAWTCPFLRKFSRAHFWSMSGPLHRNLCKKKVKYIFSFRCKAFQWKNFVLIPPPPHESLSWKFILKICLGLWKILLLQILSLIFLFVCCPLSDTFLGPALHKLV